MKVWVVYGIYNDYEGDDWTYAYCSTKEIAERELAKAIAETNEIDNEPEFLWEIREVDVITK